MERVVDYLIIGAGIAGTVLERYLRGEDVVVVDRQPGGYRIGESIIPTLFNGHLLRDEALDRVRALPSYSAKHGTTFVGRDSVAAFPLLANDRELSMHVARHELDAALHRSFRTPIREEHVEEVDVVRRVVRTDRTTYRVRRQILDCSGHAMVVARSLDAVEQLFPVYARWGYFDVTDVRPERFLAEVRARGKRYLEYDLGAGTVLAPSRAAPWDPSHSTTLTHVDDGLWAWQIPLYDRRLLSFGVVSRDGPVDADAFDEIAARTASGVYELARRPVSRDDPFSITHVRNGFACTTPQVASMGYILVADAAMFADPIYSVGTGLAAMSAVDLAGLLRDGGWSEAKRDAYQRRYDATREAVVAAFDAWYHDALLYPGAAAAPAVQEVLDGTVFQRTLLASYRGAMLATEHIDRVGEWEEIAGGWRGW